MQINVFLHFFPSSLVIFGPQKIGKLAIKVRSSLTMAGVNEISDLTDAPLKKTKN